MNQQNSDRLHKNSYSIEKTRKVFDDRLALTFIRYFFFACRLLPSKITSRFALRIFLTPGKRAAPQWEVDLGEKAQKDMLMNGNNQVVVYRWGSGDKHILLCHAWGGRGTQLGNLVEPLIANGYSVITFDAPAHGASPGKTSDMVEYVTTISLISQKYGPFDAVVGHSFGAGNILWAIQSYELRAKKIILMGCFIHGIWVIDAFGEALGLPKKIVEQMRNILEKRYVGELKWDRLSMIDVLKTVSSPLLLVHDRQDKVIPYTHVLQLFDASRGNSELLSTDGLGHWRILRDRNVVNKVVDFIGSPGTIVG